jgi:hypothetical protein
MGFAPPQKLEHPFSENHTSANRLSIRSQRLLALTLASAVLGQQSVIHGRVVGVSDGDTLKVLVAQSEAFTHKAFVMPQRKSKRSVPAPKRQ